jgi:hypothetical protein
MGRLQAAASAAARVQQEELAFCQGLKASLAASGAGGGGSSSSSNSRAEAAYADMVLQGGEGGAPELRPADQAQLERCVRGALP